MPTVPYTKPKVPQDLIDSLTLVNLKERGVLKETQILPETTQYVLENGIKIVLNSFDQVLSEKTKHSNTLSFHGFTSKGVNYYTSKDYFSALYCIDIVKNSGVGGLDKFELDRFL